MPKYQYRITLNCGEVVKSIAGEMTDDEKEQSLELMEYAAKGEIKYFKFMRDTGNMVIISKDALNNAKYFELAEVDDNVPQPFVPTDGTE